MIVDGIVHHGPDEHLHTGCPQIADAIDDDEQYGIVDGEKEQKREHSCRKACAPAAPFLFAQFIGQRLCNGERDE